MTAMVETNPDYSRQMYEPQYNSHRPPDPPVVTSGLVSESDIRHQERQERLKYELSKEYHDHMQKSDTGGFKDQRMPVYYRREPPEEGLPLGNYAHARRALDEERHREYNRFMHEKEEAARQRREEIMRRQSPTRQPPQSDMYDHNQMSQHLREERRREYNDFLDPRSQHNGDYNDMNDQQHQEQILNRAQNQVDMPVLDRRNQSPVRDAYNSPSVPPLGLDRRPPSGRWDPESYRQTNYAPVKRLSSPPHQANIGADDYSEYRRKVERDSRNSEYNQFLARKQVEDDARKQKMNEVRRQPAAPVVKGDYYDSESYDLKRQYLMEEKHKEYQNYLKKPVTPPIYGLPIGPQQYVKTKKMLELQRNRDYNEYLRKKKSESAGRSPTPTNLGLPLSQNEYDSRRKHLELERNKEYNELLAKKGEPFARYDMRNRSDNESPRAKGVELSVRSDLQDQDSEGDKSPHRSRSNAYYGSTIGALLTGKELNYPNSARQRFLEEKKHAYNEQVKPEKADTKRREEQKYKMQTYGIDLDTVKIFPQGEYVEKHKALEQEWRKDYRDFASKKREALREDIARREAMYNQHLNQAMESPPIIPTGEYDLKKKQFQDQWKDEWKSYLERVPQPKNERSKDFWGNDERVRTIPQSGEFKGRKERMQSELRKELHEYLDKKQGDLQPRKPYNPNGPENRIGFMANLGTSLDRQRESLAHQRHEEYNNFLKDRYALHGKPQGRPSWVDRQVLPDSWYKPSIQRNDDRTSKPRDERPDDRPGSQRRSGTNQSYEDMLQAKRRQEANYRREDYHDYSRPGDRY